MHALLLSLVALGDGTLRETSLDFVVLLDEGTAETPVADTAVAHAAALNAESLTDLTTLHHGVDPTTASDAVDGAKDEGIAVAGIGSLHGRIPHAIGSFTQENAWAKGTEQARVAGRTVAQVALPFLVLDIGSLRVLLSHCD